MALTVHAMVGDEQRCLDAGCDAHETEPVDLDRLTAKVHELLARHGA